MYIIRSISPPDYSWEYWNNIDGWTDDIAFATIFTEQETKQYNLPINGEWVKLGQ